LSSTFEETAAAVVPAVKDRAGVQSLERAFAILEVVAAHPNGVSLAELSKQVALHNSTAFHLVRTMVQLGYVRQAPETKRYHVGRMLFTLAAGSLTEIELVSAATPILEDLARETGETCHLAVRSGNEVVVVARSAGAGAFQMTDRSGGVRPVHATGLGKMLFAGLPRERLEAYLAEAELSGLTPKTITGKDELRAEFERVRRAGVAYDDGEFDPEVRCVAAPVRDFTGRVTAAVGISGPIWRMTLQRLPEVSAHAASAADRLSSALGAPGLNGLARD